MVEATSHLPPPREGYLVIGPTPPGTVCTACHAADGAVLKIKRDKPGAKPETLHERCAEGWFN